MTNKELQEKLKEFDENLEVIGYQHSDYTRKIEYPYVVELIDHKDYIEHYFPNQYKDSNRPELTKFLLID